MNSLKEKIKNKSKMIGTHVSLSDPCVSEIFGYMDFDYIWIDMEHTYIDCEVLYRHLNAAKAAGGSVIVRIPQHDYNTLKRVLEMGVDGIVFPMITSMEQAKADIEHTLYPPLGVRGFGPRRAVRYGLDSVDKYIREDSLDICRFIQVEHIAAIDILEELVSLPYIDGFIFGPFDLSGSIGELGNVYGERMTKLVGQAVNMIKAAGKYCGLSIGDFTKEGLRHWSDLGIDMISAGGETDYLIYGAKEAYRNLKEVHKDRESGI